MKKSAYKQSASNDSYYVHEVTPEQRMIGALIERAILDAVGNCRVSESYTKEKIVNQAKRWIFSWREHHIVEQGTFGWCCDALGLETIAVQRIVRTAIKEKTQFLHTKPLSLANCIKPLEY